MRIMIRQLAPGMVQQMQSVCTDCNGEGKGLESESTLTISIRVVNVSQHVHVYGRFADGFFMIQVR